jgi:hypothetical protein
MAVPADHSMYTESYQTALNGSTRNTSARIAYKCVPAFPRLSASYGKPGSRVCFVAPLCYHPPALRQRPSQPPQIEDHHSLGEVL